LKVALIRNPQSAIVHCNILIAVIDWLYEIIKPGLETMKGFYVAL